MRESTINNPAVYCGTYAKYNGGSLFGAWMYPADYDSLEDFYEACKQLHKDEADPEFMFQDCDYVPAALYCESRVSEELFEFCKTIEDMDKATAEAYAVYANNFDDLNEDEFNMHFVGEELSDEDLGIQLAEEDGILDGIPDDVAMYFDYALYGRDKKISMTITDGFMFWD